MRTTHATGESWRRYGPMGEHVAALVERLAALSLDEVQHIEEVAWSATGGHATRSAAWDTAWCMAWGAAWSAARFPAWYAARGAAWSAAWGTASDAAVALVTRDLIGTGEYTQAHYDTLTGPLRRAGITVHPDDKELP